ncbi:malate dehydrogenase [Chloroflexota bacterium]
MKISIIGAVGCIGSSIAFRLATERLANEIILADIRQDWLEHHYFDIFDATVAGVIDINVNTCNHEDIANSDIIIMAAGTSTRTKASVDEGKLPLRQRLLPDNLVIIKEWAQAINQFCPQSVVITATNPAEVLNYASYLLSSTKKRNLFIGYSLNDTIRFKIAISQVFGVEPTKIEALVVGEHGGSMVSLLSSVKIDGKSVVFEEDDIVKILEQTNDFLPHMIRLKVPRTSGWLTGVGIAMLVKAIINDTREVIPCCAILDGEYGYQGISIGVPVALGRMGICEIIEYKLTSNEKGLLDQSVNNIQASVNYVLEHI